MDGANIVLFLAAAFAGGLVSGLSGFAMGLVVSGIWLHLITPEQNAMLIVMSGLVTQGSGIWRVRHSLNWRKLMPIVFGCLIGVPAGTALLATVNQSALRIGMGALLIVYSLYNLLRPTLPPVKGNTAADIGAGVANGLIGGLTGLAGIAVTIWCQLRGGPKDTQRAIFQPVMFATLAITAVSYGVAGSYTIDIFKLFLMSLPVLAAGLWCGIHLYGKLDDAVFRKAILLLLLAAGISLTVQLWRFW